jgi:hypothetical protein
MPYRLIVRRIVLEVIDILTITIQPAHAERGEAEDSPRRAQSTRSAEREEGERSTDFTDLKDSEDSENPSDTPFYP